MTDEGPGIGLPPTVFPKDVGKVGRETARLPGSGEFTLHKGPVNGPFGYMEHFSFNGETGFKISATQILDNEPDGKVDFNHATTTYRIEAPMKSDGRTPTSHRTIVTFQTHQSTEKGGGQAVASSILTSLSSNDSFPYGCTIAEQEYQGEHFVGEPTLVAVKYGDVVTQVQTAGAASTLNKLQASLRAEYDQAQLAIDENGKPLSNEMRRAYTGVEAAFGKVRDALVPKLQHIHDGKLKVDPPPQPSS